LLLALKPWQLVPDSKARTLSARRFLKNYVAVWLKFRTHDLTTHWHPMVRAGIATDPPMQFASTYFHGVFAFLERLANSLDQFQLELFGGGHVVFLSLLKRNVFVLNQ
jgi:hypothetical protein